MITCNIHRADSLHKTPSRWWICDVFKDGEYLGYFLEGSKRDAKAMFAILLRQGNFNTLRKLQYSVV